MGDALVELSIGNSSTAPPPPVPILIHISEVETRIGIAIARTDAAYADCRQRAHQPPSML